MKKKIVSIALIAMSLFAFNGMAQTVSENSGVKTEKVAGDKGGKGKKDRSGAEKKEMKAKKNPYEGLNLTDAQKSKLEQLDNSRREQRQQKMQASKEAKQQDRAAKMAARKADRKKYLDDVKAIVGPDQYVVFLENFYVDNAGQGAKKAIKQGQRDGKKGMAHNKGGKGKKDGKKGDRQNKGNRAQKQDGSQTKATA